MNIPPDRSGPGPYSSASVLRTDVRFCDPGPPIAQHDIDQVKIALGGIALPQDYEWYLLRFNGAHPSVPNGALLRLWWPADTLADSTDHSALLGDMYYVRGRPERACDLLETHQDMGHLLPPDTLAFASDPGGSRFLFDLRPGRFGQVLFWNYRDIGNDEMFAANPFHNVAWVANDFIDFINRIECVPDDWNAWEAALPPDSDLDWRSR